jgi:hypothetical protein
MNDVIFKVKPRINVNQMWWLMRVSIKEQNIPFKKGWGATVQGWPIGQGRGAFALGPIASSRGPGPRFVCITFCVIFKILA